MEEFVSENYEEMNDRELARELYVSVSEIESVRDDSGSKRLDDFIRTDELSSLSLEFELSEMEKRKIQGAIGERIAGFSGSRIKSYLRDHVRGDWEIRDSLEMICEDPGVKSYRNRYSQLDVSGNSIRHRDMSREDIMDSIESKYVLSDRDTLESFYRVLDPWIDIRMFGVEIDGLESVEFDVNCLGSGFSGKLDIELPVVEDFKILALEVKTTEDSAENLLSSHQRDLREMSKSSPYIEYFTVRIDREFSDMDIAEAYDLEVSNHS